MKYKILASHEKYPPRERIFSTVAELLNIDFVKESIESLKNRNIPFEIRMNGNDLQVKDKSKDYEYDVGRIYPADIQSEACFWSLYWGNEKFRTNFNNQMSALARLMGGVE